jgi:cell division protease FtsH
MGWRASLGGWLQRTERKRNEPPALLPRVEEHLGVACLNCQAVSHPTKPVERVNLQRVLDRWAAAVGPAGEAFGHATTGYGSDESIVRSLINDELRLSAVEREQLESGPDETLDCVRRGGYLMRHDGRPVVVFFRPPHYTIDLPVLDVLAADRAVAAGAMSALLTEANRENVYRGRAVTLESSGSWREEYHIRFRPLRPTARDDIVLPAPLIAAVERNVLGLLRHGETLRKAGRSTRHGLLFHGPPGTGKTMMIRYLAHACRDHTIIQLTGRQLGLIRESCRMAKLLAPSLVVLEDVDLIAQERSDNNCPVILHELLDEMDGLGTQAECVFLLTTNRPDVLEPALSARPGRIDQAIEFPLPDADARRRLFAVYGRGLDLTGVQIEEWVRRSDGVSPAFIEELLRKAALMAAERGAVGEPLPVAEADVQTAVDELVLFGGELTQKLLGYRSGKMGFQAD